MLRRRLVPVLIGALAFAGLAVPATSALATADAPTSTAVKAMDECPEAGCCPDSNPNCHVGDDDSTTEPPPPGDPGTSGPRKCTWNGTVVPCSNAFGVYVGEGCYVAIQDPAYFPPFNDNPNGRWYTKSCALGLPMQNFTQLSVWLITPPANPPSPEELARRALATIRLDPPAVGLAPDPNGAGLVGLPVWMWTTANANTWGPIGASATDTGLTVTITAQATKIVWTMGNGDSVTCANPGTPYDGTARPSPTCGYTYYVSSHNQPGGRYGITATSTWEVRWAGGGETGVIVTTRTTANLSIEISELQVVVE